MIRNRFSFLTGVAALTLVFGAGPLFARNNSNTGTNDNSSADAFAKEAAQVDMGEVKLGHLAEQKGTMPVVKDFGRLMVQNHTENDKVLDRVASRDRLAVPQRISKADEETYDRLSQLSGRAFDSAYAQDMVKDHEKAVSEFQTEIDNAKNPAVKNYAEMTEPLLKVHLDLARVMEHDVSLTGRYS